MEIVDDMPFLVDSVTAELNRQGLTVHLAAHPVIRIVRSRHIPWRRAVHIERTTPWDMPGTNSFDPRPNCFSVKILVDFIGLGSYLASGAKSPG
ncbi:hypothetical protein ACCD06_23035 [Azospirillum sp. CT11-132]|uniref:hypothetical protein n=1 Tax=Azospirillum sp. CT11-132 TaxID=3396317 RepID=UPI0039A4C0B7